MFILSMEIRRMWKAKTFLRRSVSTAGNNETHFFVFVQRILWIATIVAVLSTHHAQASSEKSKRAIASNGGYVYEPPNEIFTPSPR